MALGSATGAQPEPDSSVKDLNLICADCGGMVVEVLGYNYCVNRTELMKAVLFWRQVKVVGEDGWALGDHRQFGRHQEHPGPEPVDIPELWQWSTREARRLVRLKEK